MTEQDEIAGLIRDSAAGYVAASGSVARARALQEHGSPFDVAAWGEMAASGWTGMLAPEELGGGGLSLREAAVLHKELGRGLVPEPLALAAHLPILVAAACGDAGLRLAGACAAGAPMAVAWQGKPGELSAENTLSFIENSKVFGEFTTVIGANAAQMIIVAARGEGGVELYALPVDAPGLKRVDGRLADGTVASVVIADGVELSKTTLLASGNGGALVDAALDQTRVILSAELIGTARQAFEMTLDYLRTRKQFGRAIGSFQALQHRAVDLYVQIELAEAALALALDQFEAGLDAHGRAAAASAVKARASDVAFLVAREAIQLHGAIAYTMEHDIGLYVARAMTTAALLGNGAAHAKRYAALTARTLAA